MSEFSTGFSFDLQRFATNKPFDGSVIGDETGVTLSELFNSAGKAWLVSDAERGLAEGQTFFWENSGAANELTPASANAKGTVDEKSVADKIQLVKGTYDDITTTAGASYHVIKSVDAVDAINLINGAATFKTIGNTTILNPGFGSTITAGGTTLAFRGSTNREADETYGSWEDEDGVSHTWEVGTKINTSNGSITSVDAAPEEEITTADGVTATFADGGNATFSNKSFNKIAAYAGEDNTAELSVTDGSKIVLKAETNGAGVNEGETAITAVLDGQTISSVDFASKTTSADLQFGGTANIGKDIAIQGGTVNVDNIDSSVAAPVTYHYSNNGNNVLDLTTATAATQDTKTKDVSVSKTGNARFLLAKDIDADSETITIGGTDYTFTDIGSNGGVFMVSNNAVTGFVFRDAGDSITVPAGSSLKFYSTVSSNSASDNLGENAVDYSALDDLEEISVNFTVNSNGEYTVTKLEDGGYEIEVYDGAEVVAGGATIGFTLPPTKANKKSAPTSAKITISNDGVLESVAPGNTAAGAATESETASFDVAGVEITFSGMNNSNVDENFAVGGVKFNTASGEFAYTVGSDTEKTGTTSSEASFKMVNEDDEVTAFEKVDTEATDTVTPKIVLAETESTGDEQPDGKLKLFGVEYNYSSPQGKAYLEASTTTADHVDFVFVNEGDTITIPEDNALDLYYQNNYRDATETKAPLTAPVSDGESYSITMTKDTNKRSALAEFELFGMAAGDTVTAGEATFEFSAEGGKFAFSSETVAAGFTAASGTVTMNPTAAALLAQASEDAALFEINGTGVNITATVDDTNELVYNQDDKSLAGLASGTVVDAGSIEKIYAPETPGAFTFGTGDDAKTYTAATMGDFERGTAAYFTVDGAVTGFTFVDVDDEITADDFSYIELTDRTTGNTFDAPIVTATANGEPARARIIKTEEDYDMDGDYDVCYAIEASDSNLAGKAVLFTDGTEASFNNANADTQLFFGTDGKLLSILGLSTEGNEVTLTKIDSELGAVLIDGNEVEITGEGFTYRLTADNEPSIVDVKAETTIIKAAGVSYVTTAGASLGEGAFTFGASAAAKTFTVSGNEDGVTFSIDDEITVSGIEGISGAESVTGALNGLALNGGASVLVSGGTDDQYTFTTFTDNAAISATILGGLNDGDSVFAAGNITDFITEETGKFGILGTSMEIAGDSSVTFQVAGGSVLSSIAGLSGIATGDFTGGITVDTEEIRISGDSSVAVTGDDSVVTRIANVSGSVALEEIGSASQVETNGDGTFNFVEAAQTFETKSSDGVTFGIDGNEIVSIDGLDQDEQVKGDFTDGIAVDGNLIQVNNGGESIIVVSGGDSGVGIYGLKDGATVNSASGIAVAVLTETDGSVTFNNGTFAVAGDSNGHVGFMLDGAGNVTSIFNLDETATVTGALSGISINTTDDPIQIAEGNDSLSYSPTDGIGGVVSDNTVVSADGASKVFVQGSDFEVTFGEDVFQVAGDTDGVTFLVEDKNNVVGVEGLDEGATLTGALSGISVNGKTIGITEAASERLGAGDGEFAVVGASEGISKVEGLSGIVTVTDAAGATELESDGAIVLNHGAGRVHAMGDEDVTFGVSGASNIVSISDFANGVSATVEGVLSGLTINGDLVDVDGDGGAHGDGGAEKIVYKADGSGNDTLVGVDSGATVNAAANASVIQTYGNGDFSLFGQSFAITGQSTGQTNFMLDAAGGSVVTAITGLTGSAEGNFDSVVTVNEQDIDVTDSDGIIKVTGGESGTAIAQISDVDGDATINNVGGASQVITKTTGTFEFAGNNMPFSISGDSSVTFNMNATADAEVTGITNFGDDAAATVEGALNGIAINGASIAVDGDDDGELAFMVDGDDKQLDKVAGAAVDISATGDASHVLVRSAGEYEFPNQAYTLESSFADFALDDEQNVTGIYGLSGAVTGDFSNDGFEINDNAFEIDGDTEVKAIADNYGAVSRIENFSGSATIVAAEGASLAIADTEGNFTDASGKTIGITGDDAAEFKLDGHGNFVGLSVAEEAGISGAIGSLSEGINGSESIYVVGTSGVNTDLWLSGGTLGGVVDKDTVLATGGLSNVASDENGEYTFAVNGNDEQTFTLAGDDDGALFNLDDNNNVTNVSGVDENATLTGALNTVTVNGSAVSIVGDNIYGVVGDTNASGIQAITGVGGTVTLASAGGANEVITDNVGTFAFAQANQKFTIQGDSSVTFGIDDAEKVTSIDELSGYAIGDFSEEITVNGSNVQVTGDRDGIVVEGENDSVAAIYDVNAGSTVVKSGGATLVGTTLEGTFKFSEGGDSFVVTGDDAVAFYLDDGDVTGVNGLTSGTISFNTETTTEFEVNPTVNDKLTFSAGDDVALTTDANGVLIGVAGVSSVNGLESATVAATGPITVNGADIDIHDADEQFNVVVNDFEVEKITDVTGNATINVADASIEANADGRFIVAGESYTIVDADDSFGLTTDRTGKLTGITSLEGSIAVADEDSIPEAFSVNGNYIEFDNTNDTVPVTVSSDGTENGDGTGIAVAGLSNGSTINGALSNASIAVVGDTTLNDSIPVEISVNEINYEFYDDEDGVIVNGQGGVVGLDDGAHMVVNEKGTYTVNGDAIAADVGDSIMGADNGAYLYDPDNILVRKSTPLYTIAEMTGIPTTVSAVLGSASDPLTPEEYNASVEAGFDLDQPLAVYTTYDEAPVGADPQVLDYSSNKFTKQVHLYDGPQSVVFNNDGGNLVHVESDATGVKNIILGDGGDVAVIDQQAALTNAVNVVGGAGDDSIFVRDNVATTIDLSEGGADRIVTFAKANAQIALTGYNASTGAGIQFDHRETKNDKGIADAIEKGIIAFGDGVVSLTTASGTAQVSLGNTESIGGSLVNLFTPEGKKQKVGFTHSNGGAAMVETTDTDDVIFIGNYAGNKKGSSILLGGEGNDTFFAGAGDSMNASDGINTVVLQDDINRKGAFINITEGVTEIRNANNTLDEIHGDTIGVDLTAMDLVFDGSNLIIKSKDASTNVLATVVNASLDGSISYDTASEAGLASSADATDETGTSSDETETENAATTTATTAAASLVPDHKYTNQLIRDNATGTLIKAAIGATGSVIDAKLDEDVRANYYLGDNSGLTFYGYNGNVFIDLEGDWLTAGSSVDGAVTAIEGITSIAAGTGLNSIKGSRDNETFFAGRGNTYLYGDGGKNLLVGYMGQDGLKEGQTTFYVLGNADGAANTISGFEFVDDDNFTNNSRITADRIAVDLPTNFVSRVALSGDDVVMEVTKRNGAGRESVVIEGAKDANILVSGDGVVADVVAKVGDDTLTFDKFSNYYNATGKNATLSVSNDQDYARVWLDGSKGISFQGDIKVIDGSGFTGTAELAGNDYDNAVIAGSGDTSLWGGNRGDDLLVAGTGANRFYYTIGNGNDTIIGAKDGDIVDLAGVTLDQIDATGALGSLIESDRLTIAFKDNQGGKIVVEGTANVGYVVQGETYYLNSDRTGFVRKA